MNLPFFNFSNTVSGLGETAVSWAGKWELLVGAAILVILAYVLIRLVRNMLANSITGIVIFLILKYVFGIAIPTTLFTIIVIVLGGVGGLAAILIGMFFGWV